MKYILEKALAKNKADRYQSASEILSDLNDFKNESFSKSPLKVSKSRSTHKKKKWIVPTAVVSLLVILTAVYFLFSNKSEETIINEKKMIAVLPFENLGPSENEYFADGLTEEITSKLSGISGLGVIARQSAIQYKKTTKSIQQIGKELGELI